MPTIVIFGASGDLTSRKLIPTLYQLHRKKRLPADVKVVGFSRTAFSHEQWREQLRETTEKFAEKSFEPQAWSEFAARIFYHAGDIGKADDFTALRSMLEQLEENKPTTRIYYLSTAPRFYAPAVEQIGAAGLADESQGVRRVVIEKPFGTDLASAHKLTDDVHRVFRERQVYRIDHYLGKETVQNMFVLRFANAIFEPLWNRNFIDHVQITAAEEVTVGDRGGYYDTAGVMRDMFQNHLMQLLSITAMEAPSRFEADLVRNEKVKVLQAVRPWAAGEIERHTLRGQYSGYRNEPDVAPDSRTATYAVAKLHIDNWRWQGVPFYLRSGKALSCRTTQIVIQFREPPHMLFGDKRPRHNDGNRLVIHIQPAEGIQVFFQTKVPDAGMSMRETALDFRFDGKFAGTMPDGYERLLLDVIAGDASLFARADEVEAAWTIVDPILRAWQESDVPQLFEYQAGMWGPKEAIYWMGNDGRQWLDVCPVLK